jgi:hypothetical protein
MKGFVGFTDKGGEESATQTADKSATSMEEKKKGG